MTTETKMHHGTVSYEEANSQAAKVMRDKLHKQIEAAKPYGKVLMERVINNVPKDSMAYMHNGSFRMDDELYYRAYKGAPDLKIHNFALSKMCETVGVPMEYVMRLIRRSHDNNAWAAELVTKLLNTHFENQPERTDRKLLRVVDGQIRGFLSDTYARLHPGVLLEAFAESCTKYGLVPYGGHVNDTQFVVRATLNHVIEPIKDEVLGIGVVFKESPFGDGASELSFQIERMMCTNNAIRESQLRRVHIGGRAPRDAADADAQYKNASESMAAEIKHTMAELFSGTALKRLAASVVAAHEAKVTHSQFDAFLKRHLNKGESEEVREIYRSTDIANLPAGDTWYRASQALGYFATKIEDESRAFEIQKLAGAALSIGHDKRSRS